MTVSAPPFWHFMTQNERNQYVDDLTDALAWKLAVIGQELDERIGKLNWQIKYTMLNEKPQTYYPLPELNLYHYRYEHVTKLTLKLSS